MPTASPTRPPLDPAARELLAACHAALAATRARSHLRLAVAGHVCGALAGLLEDAEQGWAIDSCGAWMALEAGQLRKVAALDPTRRPAPSATATKASGREVRGFSMPPSATLAPL